jgi:hypothetical protein
VLGSTRSDQDRRCDQEPLDFDHRRDELGALPYAEGRDDGRGRIIGASIKHGPLGQPVVGQVRRTYSPVSPALFDLTLVRGM